MSARTVENVRERLIVALDLSSVREADAMVSRLGGSVSFYKIGYQLAFAGGLPFAAGLVGAGKQVFLDLKLHDIGNTVTKGVESVAGMGAAFLTVHAYPQTMKAALDASRGRNAGGLADLGGAEPCITSTSSSANLSLIRHCRRAR